MNTLPTFSRACVRQELTFRSILVPQRGVAQMQQIPKHLRSITTVTTSKLPDDVVQDTFTSSVSSQQPSISSEPSNSSTPEQPTRVPQSIQRLRRTQAPIHPKLLTGTVTRTGTMQSCIQLTYQTQKYDSRLQKHYTRPNRLLVHDPNPRGYLREGDVIEYSAWSADEKQARLDRRTDMEARIADEIQRQRQQHQQQQQQEQDDQEDKKGKVGKSTKLVIRRRFMTGPKRTGNHGTGEEKWVGPRYVVRRVVTPFGTGLDQRMEEVVSKATVRDLVEDVKVKLKGKRGNAGKAVASAKTAG